MSSPALHIAPRRRFVTTLALGALVAALLGACASTPPERDHAVLDSVRAALGGLKNLSNRVILPGQSQGGGAAFATAGYAATYAADVHVLGTVATGTPDLAHTGPSPHRPDEVNPTPAYIMYLGVSAQALDPAMRADQLFQARALPVYAQARDACIAPMEKKAEPAGLANATTLTPSTIPLLTRVLGTGGVDRGVATAQQVRLAKDACAAGTRVQQHVYPGLDHSATVNASLADSIPFVRRLLAGEPVASTCGAS